MMRTRCRTDLPLFARYFFSEVCWLPPSELHRYLFARRAEKSELPPPVRRGCMDVVVAPRGAAKSTLISLVFPIHALLYKLDPFIVLISATERQAVFRLDNIRTLLLTSKLLRRYYARELAKINRNSSRTLLVNGVRIDAFSAGSELRGITHGAWRPSWIVLDDVESSRRILASQYRTELAEWMSEVVENLGNGYTNIDLIGTLLHSDALPVQLARRPNTIHQTFRSIEHEATATELWDEWRTLLFDLTDPNRTRTARRFFEQRSAAMLKGAQVLWPEKESYYDLQVMRATRGVQAFNKEKQNDPSATTTTVFPLHRLERFDPADATTRSMGSMRVFGFLDPAMGDAECKGRAASGDFAAIVTVGIDQAGYLFVLDAWLERVGPSGFIPRIFELHQKWNYTLFGIETNAFQKCLLDPINAHRRNCGAELDIRPVNHRTSKRSRIASLEPLVHNGWMSFSTELPKVFMDQLADFPNGRHDDGPDALEAAVALARSDRHKGDPETIKRGGKKNVSF